jgi:hypothetical protein
MATARKWLRVRPARNGRSRGTPKEVTIWKVENDTAIQNRSRPSRPSPKLSGNPCSGFTDSDGASIWASSDVFAPWLMGVSSRP